MKKPKSILLAMIQPRVIVEPDPEKNVDKAISYIESASKKKVDLVLFPEGYPGPILRKPKIFYDAGPRITVAAKDHKVAVCWSRMEHCDDGHFRLVVYVIDSNGSQILRYGRTHPATLPLRETEVWVAPGDEGPPLFSLNGVPMSVVVCSELWIPEYARVAAICGVEVILSPAGGRFTSLKENWEIVARARAIENLCYLALTNNIWGDEVGSAMITGPEKVEASSGTQEMICATIDLERVRWLRARDDSISEPKPFSSIPGLLRARRPELFKELVKSQKNLFDYFNKKNTSEVKEEVA